MKTYDEMTQSVLQRATAGIAERDRRRKTILTVAATGLCLALVLAAVGAFREAPTGTDDPNPTISMQNPTTAPTTQPTETEPILPPAEMKVYFLSHNATQVSRTQFLKDVRIPVDGRIRVHRFDGLSDAERDQAIAEEEAIIKAHQAENSNYPSGVASVYTGLNAMVSLVNKGSITLEFADKDQYESVDIETTGVGGVSGASISYFKAATYGEGENQITYPAGTMLYVVNWTLSYETKLKLMNSPNMAFSAIRDTITITVNFSNGEKQTLIVDVTVDDDGYIYMTQRGNITGV